MASSITNSWMDTLHRPLRRKERYRNPLTIKGLSLLLLWLMSCVTTQNLSAQACGTCASANCTAVKQYANKAAALAGVGKIWQLYSTPLTSAAGTFTVYVIVRTDANGQVSVMQEIQISGPSTGIQTQAGNVVATRTYGLYNLSDATCANKLTPNISNDGCSGTFNPAWTNLLPNTDYKLALTTNLSVLAAGYQYQGFNMRFYHAVRTVTSFTFNCGTASASGTFIANGLDGQAGTLTVPITGATAGVATITVSGNGFSGTAAVNLAAGQTSVSVPLTFNGSGTAGNKTITVTSAQGTGTCTPTVVVNPVIASFAFNCGTASATGTFSANGTSGQTGSLTVPLSNVTAGTATFNVSGNGFTGTLNTTLTAGQASVVIPISFNGSGVAGNRLVSVSSTQGTGNCALTIAVTPPTAGFTFNCASGSVVGTFYANGVTNQNGFVSVPLTGATAGYTVFTVAGTGFTGSLTTTLVANQASVTIPIAYDGSGSAGTRPLSITSSQGMGTCALSANVSAATPNGAITFNCPTTASVVGNFVANGAADQKGIISINFTTQTTGLASFTVSGNGFSGSLTTTITAGQATVNVLVTYDGTGAAGNHAVTVTSPQATGTCAMDVPVKAVFGFNCGVFNTSSTFIANGLSQTSTVVLPLSNVSAGSATFAVSGNGFTGSLTTTLRDSQRFVAIPVTYDGSGAVGGHSVTVTSSQGSGMCTINVMVKDPALNGCDYIKGQSITVNIHSQNTGTGFSTEYILVDTAGIIRYRVAAMPFTGVVVGDYLAYAVNYSGTAPTLTAGTNLNAIGGTCASLSNAYDIKVCPAYEFSCGNCTYTGVFIANGNSQMGTLHVTILNALPISTTLNVSGGGFSGTKTEVLMAGQTIVDIPVTYTGAGSSGVILVNIGAANAGGMCTMGVDVLPAPPASNFTFTCASAVINGTFLANSSLQSGSVTVPLTGVVGGTTDFSIIGTGFTGGLTNVVLTAGQTSITIPVIYDGRGPAGMYPITINSPHASAACNTNVNVMAVCVAGTTPPSVTDATASNICPATSVNLTTLPQTVTIPIGTTLIWSTHNTPTTVADTLTTAQASAVTTAGKYYALFYDKVAACYSPADSVDVTITPNPSAPTVTLTQPTCSLSTGTITVDAPSSGVTYSFDNGSTYQASNIKSGLTASTTYQVVVKNNTTACVSTATPSVINAVVAVPSAPTATVSTQPTCSTATASVSLTGLPSTGTWTLTRLNTTTLATYVVTTSGSGSTFSYSNVPTGNYTYTVKNNATTCESTASNVITVNPPPTQASLPSPIVAINQPNCTTATGTVTITSPSSGVTYSFDNGATFAANNVLANATTGTYQIVVKYTADGCETLPIAAKVNAAPTTGCSCNNATGRLTFSNSNQNTSAAYTQKYVLTTNDGVILQTSATPLFTGLMSSQYAIYGVNYETTKGVNGLTVGQNIAGVNGAGSDVSVPSFYTVCRPVYSCNNTSGTITPSITGQNTSPSYTQAYALADTEGSLLRLAATPSFTGLDNGQYQVFAVNYETSSGVTGFTVGQNMADITGACFNISTPLYYQVCLPPYHCNNASGNITAKITGQNTNPSYTQSYALTESAGLILQLATMPSFTGLMDGKYKIFALNYETSSGVTGLTVGQNIGSVTGSCLSKSSPLQYQVCIMPEICNNQLDDDGDGLIDCEDPDCTSCGCDNTTGTVTFTNTGAATTGYTQTYVLTDSTAKILKLSNALTFNNLASGRYRIYAINYRTIDGITGLVVGQNLDTLNGACFDKSLPLLFKACVCATLDLKVFLEGPFQTGTSTMQTVLNQRGLLPGQTPIGQFAVTTPASQPYKNAPWNYAGTEGDTITTYPSTVVDWVLVSLRSDSTTLSNVIRVTGWLHSDGHISFINPCFTLTNGAYFVVIEHRNHVGVMSAGKALVLNNTLNYDFTTTDSYIKINPPSFGEKLKGTKWVMYAGDGKKDSFINNYDINFSDSFLWKGESGIFDRYKQGDFDMNADVNFLDSYLWKLNSGKYSLVPHY